MRIKVIPLNWTPLIKLQDIRDVFIGKDIIKNTHGHHNNIKAIAIKNLSFSVVNIYKSFNVVKN